MTEKKVCKHRWEQVWPGTYKCNKCEEYTSSNKSLTYDVSHLTSPITLAVAKPNHSVTFINSESKQVGKLDFNGDRLEFEGDADESAKVFVDAMGHWFAGRVEQEREKAAERAWKALVDAGCDWSIRQAVTDAIKGAA